MGLAAHTRGPLWGEFPVEVINMRREAREPFERAEDVASFTECTGLIPALPQDDAQAANAAALYAIHKAKKAKKPKHPVE